MFNNSVFFLFAPKTDHHLGHVITGLGMIRKLVKMRTHEWIGQILLISLLWCKMTFYKAQQENERRIVNQVAVLNRRVLFIFKPRKKHFLRRDI